MGESKIVNFFKRYNLLINAIIWTFLASKIHIICTTADISTKVRTVLIAFGVIYTFFSLIWFVKGMIRYVDKGEENKRKYGYSLKQKYEKIVSLVLDKAQDSCFILKNGDLMRDYLDIDDDCNYLFDLDRYIKWVCKNRIVGEPDTFIIASCLLYAIIDNPVLVIDGNVEDEIEEDFNWNEYEKKINFDLALECVFELISEPTTYYKDGEVWLPKIHPKVDIDVPKGIIDNSPLYHRIKNTLYHDERDEIRTSIMQFSNLLHLVYLNSCKTYVRIIKRKKEKAQ